LERSEVLNELKYPDVDKRIFKNYLTPQTLLWNLHVKIPRPFFELAFSDQADKSLSLKWN
jgi:hypothetical protein